MSNKITATLLALTLIVLAGCSSNPTGLDRKALAVNKIAVVDLVSPAQLTYTRSQAGQTASRAVGLIGGGLIGTVVGMGVDGAINMNRASTVAPIIKALGNYNTNTVLQKKLAAMRGPSFAPNLKVTGHKTPVKSNLNVLNVATNYILSSNHQAVSVSAVAQIKQTEKSAVHTGRFAARAPIDMNLKEGEKINATEWLTKNPSKLKQAIESAMDNIVQQISVDMNIGKPAAKKPDEPKAQGWAS